MLTAVSPSSPLFTRLHVMPVPLVLFTLCIYATGFLVAYVAFLVDRKATIKSIWKSLPAKPDAAVGIRSLETTSADRREALLAAAIWPALLALFVCPL